MDYSLSDGDIKFLTNGRCKIETYDNIKGTSSIDELFGDTDCIALLYQLKSKNYGHWTALIRDRDNMIIYYFDPYGGILDDPINHVDPRIAKELHANHNYLARLIEKDGYSCDYSDYPLQRLEDGINTCGRHVAARIIHNDLTNDEYVNEFYEGKRAGSGSDEHARWFTDEAAKFLRSQ